MDIENEVLNCVTTMNMYIYFGLTYNNLLFEYLEKYS